VRSGSMPFRVLLIEDNLPDVMLVRHALDECGLDVALEVIYDAEEAAAYISRMGETEDAQCPDIVLLDLNVPKGDGLELLATFRTSPKCPDLPIVIMTSSDSPRDRTRATEIGATRYFRKPIDLDQYLRLGALVEEVLIERLAANKGTRQDGSGNDVVL
jgi:CheY-like chemotaxis protein